MNNDIEELIKRCDKCATYQNKLPAEPLKPTEVPDFPYAVVGSGIFEFGAHKYVLCVDYYSKFIDVVELKDMCNRSTIDAPKSFFATHGIPRILRSDNGPQYRSTKFKDFANAYTIKDVTSSPNYARSNGESERAVQSEKL